MQKKVSKTKTIGRQIVDSERRHNADMGGRGPLTEYALVPLGMVVPMSLSIAIKERSDQFISPKTFKPYGITSLTRILAEIMVGQLSKYYEMDYLAYVELSYPGKGRAALGAGTHKLSLLIPTHVIEAVNSKVLEYNNTLIGTSTIVRFLVEKGLAKVPMEEMYKYIPESHKDIMLSKGLTIKTLQTRYAVTKSNA